MNGIHRIAAAVGIAVLLAACSNPVSQPTGTTTFSVQAEDQGSYQVSRPIGCETELGTPIDLDSEPAFWLAFNDFHRWFDSDGCPVRIDVISHQHLAEHCGWESAEAIAIGRTLGEPFENSLDSRRFVFNTSGVVPGIEPGEELTAGALPESAHDTGYRQDEAELWIDDADPATLLVVGPNVKVLRLESDAGICS